MPGKRRRPVKADQPQAKRAKIMNQPQVAATHPILSLYYPQVKLLREYLLQCLPTESRSRRRKIQGISSCGPDYCYARDQATSQGSFATGGRSMRVETPSEETQNLAWLLDTTLIGVSQQSCVKDIAREQDFAVFSQRLSTSNDGSDGPATISQSEVGN